MNATINITDLKTCIENAVCEQASYEGEELDPHAPDFDAKFEHREKPVLALFAHLGQHVSVDELKAIRTSFETATLALSQAIFEAENPQPALGAEPARRAEPSMTPGPDGKRIHRDQIRLHLEAMIDPYLGQFGAPNDEARARAQALLVETFMNSFAAFAVDDDGTVAVEHLILAASVNEYQSKALHNAAFSVFSKVHAN